MRYSLRTLLIVMLLGGPALAGAWWTSQQNALLAGILYAFAVALFAREIWREWGWTMYWWDVPDSPPIDAPEREQD
jgi:hypothetical protein